MSAGNPFAPWKGDRCLLHSWATHTTETRIILYCRRCDDTTSIQRQQSRWDPRTIAAARACETAGGIT